MKNTALILAAGSSSRCGFDKLFSGRSKPPILHQTLAAFQECEDIHEILLVLSLKNIDQEEALRSKFTKIKGVVLGKGERYNSLCAGIDYLVQTEKANCRLIVHNGANPHITSKEISEGIDLAKQHKNVIYGYFTPNSIKKVQGNKVTQFLNRDEIFETQTPQISDLKTLKKAIESLKSKSIPRDEAELLGQINEEIHVYECSPQNTKITFAHDFGSGSDAPKYQIGMGEDHHAFEAEYDPQKPLTIGGVALPKEAITTKANSDGDVIFHALTNAILSSVGEKTLSEFSDKMCQEGIKNSKAYVNEALKRAKKVYPSYCIENVAVSVEALRPKLQPYHEEIQKSIARSLEISESQVGFTYTTGEGLSSCGRGEGIRCLVQILTRI